MVSRIENPYTDLKLGKINQKTNLASAKESAVKTSKIFSELLSKEIASSKSELKFSKHAEERMSNRNIVLTQGDLTKLNEAVTKVADKGAKESLFIMDQVALVVSVKNNTVITAVDKSNLKDNIFTNIDSAVII